MKTIMARYTFKMQRLFIDHPLEGGGGRPLAGGREVTLDKNQSNYLVNVLRMKAGDALLVFNGRDGEWRATLANASKKAVVLMIDEQLRVQPRSSTLDYCFAPLKQARLDYMVQKAVEMGAGRLRPVITAHTQVTRLNLERMRANVIEAAEQCGILNVPEVLPPVKLQKLIDAWPEQDRDRDLIFCDEGDEGDDPITLLRPLNTKKQAVIIGPEGGFSEEERHLLKAKEFVMSISLGPRILRADTAAVAALAVVQAACGDWMFGEE